MSLGALYMVLWCDVICWCAHARMSGIDGCVDVVGEEWFH